MSEPGWLKTVSNHAVISKAELQEWLGVNSEELRIMLIDDTIDFPRPRFGGFRAKTSARITSTNRWRVGDVRAWLTGSSRQLEKQLSAEIGAERSETNRRFAAKSFF